MPPNLEATRPRARYVWKDGRSTAVSFPTLPRAFKALDKLTQAGQPADYDGRNGARHWVRIYTRP
jgi:hypothetical protein